jgi:alkylation response protein AidB-like acyl-CoA dehydrogenase
MDLLPSPDQNQIIDTIRDFLGAKAPVDRLRTHGAIGNPDASLWPELADLGFLGITLEENMGGSGLGSAEEMLIFREFGRHLISPAIFGLVLGARIAARVGDVALRNALLAGSIAVGIANPLKSVSLGAEKTQGEFHLFEAASAPWVVVTGPEGSGLFSRKDFVERYAVNSTDAALGLERGSLRGAAPRLWVDAATDPIHRRALLLLAAYAVGLGEGARDMAVEYAKVREQFGKPIGSFQAIKHICADMAIRSEAALCQVSFAALVFAQARDDAAFHVIASKIVSTDAALKNAAANIQVHGAFGFTAEANAHHYLKRAHVADLLWGDLKHQRERLIELPAPA